MMYAIKAIYDGTGFKPVQPIPVAEDYEVVITFVKPVNPFGGTTERPKTERAELRGFLKGKVWMSDDFNEPLIVERKNDCPLRGLAADSGLTVDSFLAMTHDEKELRQ
jgi:predicted DNA-binding antitoxin AbrB/MazE fold protein